MSIQPLAVRIEGDLIRVVASDQIISGGGGGGGVTDHGALTGLAADDHPQYLLVAAAAEFIRDTMGTALVAGTNITLTVNDAGDTITLAMPGAAFETAGAVAAHAAAGDPHPTYTTAAELSSALTAYLTSSAAPELIRDTMGTALVAGTNITLTVNDAGDTITIAASGGGSGVRKTPTGTLTGLRSIQPGLARLGNNDTAITLVAGTTYYFPIFVEANTTVDGLIAFVGTLSAGNMRLAVMTASSTWQPATLLADSGLIATGTTGVKTATFAEITLAPGPHLFGVRSDATPVLKGTNVAWPSSVCSTADPFYESLRWFSVTETFAAFASTPTAWTTIANTTAPVCPIALRGT